MLTKQSKSQWPRRYWQREGARDSSPNEGSRIWTSEGKGQDVCRGDTQGTAAQKQKDLG